MMAPFKKLVESIALASLFFILGKHEAGAASYALGTTNILEGPAAGIDSVTLGVNPAGATWSATTNATWLHLTTTNRSGTGSANIIFSFDANAGATRNGTLTIGGQTATVTQAGATYTAIPAQYTSLVPAALESPEGVAVDGAGNIYIADAGENAIKKWSVATHTLTTLVSTGLNLPYGVAVDTHGDVYIADSRNNAVKKWTAANNTVSTLVSNDLNFPQGVAVDAFGNVFIADTFNNAVKMWSVTNQTVTTIYAEAPQFTFRYLAFDAGGNLYMADANGLRLWTASTGQTTALAFSNIIGSPNSITGIAVDAATNLYVGFNNGIVVASAADYNFTTLLSSNFSGHGLAMDAASNFYTADDFLSQLVEWSPGSTNVSIAVASELLFPIGVAVDSAGNVIIADCNHYTVKKWIAASNTVTPLFTTGTGRPGGLAVDPANNIYYSDADNPMINEWTASDQSIRTIYTNGLEEPTGLVLDGNGNLYFCDFGATRVGELSLATSNVTTIVSDSQTSSYFTALAVDAAGNVFISSATSDAEKWPVGATNGIPVTVAINDVPANVAVDGAGNVYVAGFNEIWKTSAVDGSITPLGPQMLNLPDAMTVDQTGNIFVADTGNNAVRELPRAFVDATPKNEPFAAGNDALPPVLPASENLRPPFAPASDASWLSITGATNGVVSFAFAANGGADRTGHVTVLGQAIPVKQTGFVNGLASSVVSGVFHLTFSNSVPSGSFTILTSTNAAAALSGWTVAGPASNIAPGMYQFTTPVATNGTRQFFCVRSP